MAFAQPYPQQQQQQPMMMEQHALSSMLHESNLVRAESMEIKNDPRFFTSNVLDKRLSAFGCLSVVSGLMVQNAMSAAFGMKKDMNLTTIDGVFQFIGFILLCGVLYGNVLATYIGVVQPYHTYRLMTAGPTGFETACAYYLHKEVVDWRHFSIKFMLMSMPVFIVSSGFRFVVKFDRDTSASPDLPSSPPLYARIDGLVACGIFLVISFSLFNLHWRHGEIFRGMYDYVINSSGVKGVVSQLDSMMTHRSRSPLDV